MKRIIGLFLSIVLVLGMFPAMDNVQAKNKKATKPSIEEMKKGLSIGESDAFDFSKGDKAGRKALKSKMADAPSSYTLRNVGGKNYITPVKFQNPFGTCWGFAAIAAAESSILGSGLAREDGYNENTLDLSEKHLVNFIVKPISDKKDSQYGEGFQYFDESKTTVEKFNEGGLPVYASSLFSSGIGPNLEDRDVPDGVSSDIYEYHGKNKWVDKRKKNGEWINYCYSDEDDWDMPEELRFKQSYVLKESFILPSPATIDDEDIDNKKYTYNPEGTLAIKDQLMNKRAVEIAFCADTSRPNQTGDSKYISKNWAHYTYDVNEEANHAVTIVGWDDNYSKNNFVEGHEPPEDGAWLVKNSWGSGEENFPNKGGGDWGIKNEDGVGTGYFWLSYYDQTLCVAEALEFDKSNVGKSYYIDQYDYMPVEGVEETSTPEEAKMANVFEAEVTEKLEQISFVTATPRTVVDYSVYVLPEDYEGPEDGVEVASGKTAPYEYGGFHKLALDNPVILNKGQHYSIVIKEIMADGNYNINFQLSMAEQAAKLQGLEKYTKGVVNPNESFIKYKGEWNDYSDDSYVRKVLDLEPFIVSRDNFPIKGYCTEMPNLNVDFNTGDYIEIAPVYPDNSESIVTYFKGDLDLLPEDPEIVWDQTEESKALFKLTPDESDSSKCEVTSIKPGTGYIKVNIEGFGTQVIKVNVTKTGKYFVGDAFMEVGEKNTICVYDYKDDVIESGYKVESLNPDIVSVSNGPEYEMTGLKVGNALIRVYDDTGAETTFTVEVKASDNPPGPTNKKAQKIKAKGKTIKVKYKKLKKKKAVVKRKKLMKLSGTKGKVTYKLYKVKKGKKAKFKKYFKISKKKGKLTVKKKLKKGTYKLKIKVYASGNKTYKNAVKTVTVKVKVK